MLIKYFIIGLGSTVIYFTLSLISLNHLNLSILLSTSIAFICAFIFSYTLQSFFVFKSKFNLKNLRRYLSIQLLIFIISYSTSTLIFTKQEFTVLSIAGLMALISFFIHKKWTFR
ncbi:GtrA family protein [Vibrio breoganii]|uniref:GtrA family protein n=1 Tax=Vibrio breoganii TaxID=553239 RepID=UPI000C837D53